MENRESINELIEEFVKIDTEKLPVNSQKTSQKSTISLKKAGKSKIFDKFKIKDIVFLAIVSAIMLLSGAFMPLVSNIPVFGIIELCLGLQFSVFVSIGLMKVRKPGSLIFMSFFSGIVLIFMNTIMFFCLLLCAVICEGLSILIFKGYKKDLSIFISSTLYMPLTLPFLYIWYKFFYTFTGKEGSAVSAFIGSDIYTVIGMSLVVIALCSIGSFIGIVVARELKKAGIIKK